MPNLNTISEEEFSVKLRHGVKYTGYVEDVGYAEWLPVPRLASTPDYPHDARMFPRGSSFVVNDYALLITPVEQILSEKDILLTIVQTNADGSKLVNMGKSEKPEELSPSGKVKVKIDNTGRRITITTYNINGDGENMQTNTRSVTYSFSQFKYEYPFWNKNITFSAERSISIDTQEVINKTSKLAYIAGIITTAINKHMGKVDYFRPIVDGWGKIYRESSRWKFSIIPGNMASKMAKMAKPVAGVGMGVTFLYDLNGAIEWDKDPTHKNAIHPAKGIMDMFFSGIGFTIWGTVPSVIYFGVDGFYPGGWEKYVEDYNKYCAPSHPWGRLR